MARGFEGTIFPGLQAKLKWGILAIGASLITAGYYFWQGAPMLGWGFVVAAFLLPLANGFDIYNSLVLGRKKFSEFTVYNSITQASLAACIIAALTLTDNIVALIATFYIANTLLNTGCFFHAITKNPPNKNIDPEAIPYGKHLTYLDVIGTVLGQADKVLIFHYLGAAELAIYAFAITPPEQVKGLLKNIQVLAMPKFAEQTRENIRKTLFSKAGQLMLISLGIAFLYIITAPFFFQLLFPQYLEAVIYSQVIVPSIAAATTTMFLYTYLEAQQATKQLYQYNVVNNIMSIAILLPAVYFGGLWGAILARTGIRFAQTILATWLVRKT
ncbi:MAG: hypothetical protein KAZ30_01825 [Candidatus Magasanikbacteria bacterium]|nr:hypothetical protein [Candidatus Magasanikbacteria bacterium]